MATFNKFQTFIGDLGDKVHDLRASGDTLKVYLTNAVPDSASHSVKADLAEITPQFGYIAGGADIQNNWTETGGIGSLTGVDVVWTATGGAFGPFRYVVLYNDTPTTPADPLVAWWDYGSSVTVNDTENFTIDFGASVLTIT